MEMQEFTNNDPDHTGEADDKTSEVSADNANEASTSAAAVKTKQDLNTLVEEKSKEKKVRPDYTQYKYISKI